MITRRAFLGAAGAGAVGGLVRGEPAPGGRKRRRAATE